MDWKKVVLVAIFSVLSIELQAVGVLTALSLVIYMLVKGMDQCRIANLGLLLEFIGILVYPLFLLQQLGINLGIAPNVIAEISGYLVLIGLILVIIGLIITMLVKNKIKENIYET
ncbi:hypothetical protein YN1_1140 [Nanoarchaeota archaeon]